MGIAPEGPGERVLATVLFTDIVDSTARLQALGDSAWHELLRLHDSRLRDDLNRFRGRELKTTGDGFLAVFDGATKAVRCGAAMVRSAQALDLSIRVGIHTGEVEFVGGDVRGVAVHAAARVMSLAGPNEVLVSSTTSDLLEGSGLVLEDAGAHELKGLSGRRQIFRLAPIGDRTGGLTSRPGSPITGAAGSARCFGSAGGSSATGSGVTSFIGRGGPKNRASISSATGSA